jgi:hypothetical protein
VVFEDVEELDGEEDEGGVIVREVDSLGARYDIFAQIGSQRQV